MKKLLFIFFVATALQSQANNIVISNVTIVNNGPGNIQVQFDLSWDNSWRVNVGPNNYDGAWVFFKYKTASGNWTHMTMTGNNNVIPAGFDVHQNSEFSKIGAILHRESTNMGVGTVTLTGVRLGVINALPYDISVRGFAIEMVYVPAPTTRPFFGDGNGVNESTNAFHYTDNTATTSSVVPMRVDVNAFDDAEFDTDGIYVYSNDTIQTTVPLGSLDAFPTMKALWCMKYEITQAAYRDFLNTLTYTQQVERTVNAPNSAIGTGALTTSGTNRNYLEVRTPGVSTTTPAVYGCDANGNNVYDEAGDGEWIACNFITWPDLAAYLDWSGLAPMSEIQFERMARGHSSAGAQTAIFGEYAWGTTSVFVGNYTLSNPATASELASNASISEGNAAINGQTTGPLRNGIFATGSSSRITSGAGYFGVMELTGNVQEFMITIGNVAGRSVNFIPNGNGTISANGNAQLSVGGAGFWPGMEGNGATGTINTCAGTCEVTASAGMIVRGGGHSSSNDAARLSERSLFTPTARANDRGGRGVLYIR